MTSPLPIDALLPAIADSLRRTPNLVIEAAPGAGKTTRVPPALLALGGGVLALEPRRIAARMAARRVAAEMGEPVGETIGYQVRFEEIAGPRTRLHFLTEGVLTRRLMADTELRGVGTVVLDEFHERHLETDLAIALLRRLQKTKRPDLRLVVMSATLDAAPVREFLGGCPLISAEGRLFDVNVEWTPYSAASLDEQVRNALESVLARGIPGDVLVFLPGAATIHRAVRACDGLARRHDLMTAPLYGDLSPAEQDLALQPASKRKVILSTNIAESSVTIDGVRVVIDSGLARIAADSPWTGLPSLEIGRVSRASAIQRAGRAGRTAPGHVIRLYTSEDFHRRPDHDEPEIARRELSSLCLHLTSMGISDPNQVEWLTPPPREAVDAAEALLDRLHAKSEDAAAMARMPLHPRLSRLLLDAARSGCGDAACRTAALLSSGQRVRSSDLFHALDEERDPRTRAVYDQLRRFAPRGRDTAGDAALAKCVLAAFPDRVGRRRPNGVILLSNGGSAMTAAPGPQNGDFGEFLVAIDIEESRGRNAPLLRLACPIEPEWLIDLFPERIVERQAVEWNRQSERVEAVSSLVYGELTVNETRGGAVDDEAAAKLLAARAMESGLGRFVDPAELDALLARIEFASEHSAVEALGEEDIRRAIETICYGLRSFADLERAASALLPALEAMRDRQLLDRIAPDRLRLQAGRQTKVHYERGKPPWVESRLQDFFGMTESPRVANGQVPLVIHLLAPNRRPVQTTTDLAGFWQRLYPQVRKELGRRYPKHAWPEKPL
ncbi:MAG TPA: ATP-dependent helicase HrpB [Bryobacteraceae bacterium]|nr:ATP-dependent helicase HrpB [Bryobacteraceae bacterium]